MKTNSLTYMLLWLSKTDPNIYNQSPQNVKWSRTNLGIFVLLTGIFAFITATFFIRSLFIELDPHSNKITTPAVGWMVSLIFAFFWAMLIIAMDREIISSNSKWGAIVRIFLALFIGFVLSLPLKVMFFQNTIYKELTQANNFENAAVKTRYMTDKDNINNNILELEKKISEHRSKMAQYADMKYAEGVGIPIQGASGKAGEGTGFRTANENIQLHEKLANEYALQLEAARQNLDKNLYENREEFLSNKINQSFDFPSQYKALNEILDRPENSSFYWLALFFMVIFMIVEALPALMKLIREKDEYDGLLNGRTAVNQQLIAVVVNDAMNKIQSSPSAFANPGSTYAPTEVMKTIEKNIN